MNKSSSDDILDNIHGYYHVKVVLSDKEELYEFDLTENHLTENIVNPYKSGRPFYFSGKFVDPFITNIQISLTKKSLGRFSLLVDEIRLFHDEEYILRTGTSRSYVLQQFQAFSRLKQDLRKNDVTTKFIQSPPIKGQATEVNHQNLKVCRLLLQIAN